MQQKCSSRRSRRIRAGLKIAQLWRRDRDRGVCINSGAQILDEQVRIRSGCDSHVAVPHEPLDAMDVDAAAEKLRRERVAQIVEAHTQLQRLGPERAATRLL